MNTEVLTAQREIINKTDREMARLFEQRMEAVKQNGADGDEKAVVEHIYQSVKGFTGSHPQSDDITIMSLRI